jgi:hypothetical protein
VSKIQNTQRYSSSMSDLWKNTEKVMDEVAPLLKSAENTTFEDRKFTYARGGPGGVIPFRTAAEKSWVALSQGTDVLVEHFLHKVPKGNYDRRLALREMEARWPDLASKHFYDRYGALTYYLRNNKDYFSTLDLDMLKFEVSRLRAYLADIKTTIK